MMRLLITISVTVLTVGTISLATGGSSRAESMSANVDKLFAEWDRPGSPGCSLAVGLNGVVVYERGYGMGNLELNVPITPASVFDACSISKAFTAMSVLLLAERGRISLDDEVAKYFPEWVNRRDHVTIRHVLAHTSGLREAYALNGFAAPGTGNVNGNDAILKMLARQRDLNFAPGTEYQYNNSGYNLLASLVKRTSGQSLRAFADANIFKPLGMTQTLVHDDPSMIVPNRVSGYRQEAGAFRIPVPGGPPDNSVGNTGVHTTARDLLRWEGNFTDARVGTPALFAAMLTPTTLPTGETTPTGLGLAIEQHRGLRTVYGAGLGPGYASYVVRYPDHGLAIAVLCNLDSIPSGGLAKQVAEIYLADKMAAAEAATATKAPPTISLSAADLASKVGLYRHAPTEMLWQLHVEDGMLKVTSGPDGNLTGLPLSPTSANRFVLAPPYELEFVLDATGNVQAFRLLGRPEPMMFERIKPLTLPPADLQAYVGKYYSSDIDTTYTVTVRDSRLTLEETPLQPIFRDGFRDAIELTKVEPMAGFLMGVVKFSRDERGAITGFTLNRPHVRNLRFDRVQAAQR